MKAPDKYLRLKKFISVGMCENLYFCGKHPSPDYLMSLTNPMWIKIFTCYKSIYMIMYAGGFLE